MYWNLTLAGNRFMSWMKLENRNSIFVMVFWPFSHNRLFSLFLDWLKYLLVFLIVSVVICPLTYLSSGVYYICCVNIVSQLKLSVMRYRYYGLIAGHFGEKWKWIGFFHLSKLLSFVAASAAAAIPLQINHVSRTKWIHIEYPAVGIQRNVILCIKKDWAISGLAPKVSPLIDYTCTI